MDDHHDHHGDTRHDDHGDDRRAIRSADRSARLRIAMCLNVVLVIAQVVAGLVAHSLGLVADAGHNLGDVAAVATSLVAVHLARRAPSGRRSFGYHRAGILAAMANAVSILAVSAVIVVEAISRFGDPGQVHGALVAATATAALLLNLAAARALHDHSDDLNMRSGLLHMLGDAAASAAVLITGLVVWATGGWDWLDPLVSIAIAAMISWHAVRLLASAADVMLQTAPRHLDLDALRRDLAAVTEVVDVHDLHVWTLAEDMVVATAHLMVRSGADMHAVLDRAQELLADRYGLDHATLQVEPDDHSGCEKLTW